MIFVLRLIEQKVHYYLYSLINFFNLVNLGRELPNRKVHFSKYDYARALATLQVSSNVRKPVYCLEGVTPKSVLFPQIREGVWLICIINPAKSFLDMDGKIFSRTKVLLGNVFNRLQNKPVTGAKIGINGKSCRKTYNDGNYSVNFSSYCDYTIHAKYETFSSDTSRFEITSSLRFIRYYSLYIPPDPQPWSCNYIHLTKHYNLITALNSAQIKRIQQNTVILDSIFEFISSIDHNLIHRLNITGHTDSNGSAEYSLDLSYLMAKNTGKLINSSLADSSIKIPGFGKRETDLIFFKTSPEKKSKTEEWNGITIKNKGKE